MKIIFLLVAPLFLWGSLFAFANASQHPLGTNFVTPDKTVFTITIENSQTVKRPYTSAGAFLSYSFNSWNSTVAASSEDLALPSGSFIAPQDGRVFCSDRGIDKGTCYLITAGKKSGFTSADVFHGLGYSFSHALHGDVSFLDPAENISTSTIAHKSGTLINKDGMVYLVSEDGLFGFSNPTIMKSWGYSFTDAVSANTADRLLPTLGSITERKLGQLSILNENTYKTNPSVVLEFKEQNLNTGSAESGSEQWKPTGLTSKQLKKASVEYQDNPYQPVQTSILLEFNSEGAELFSQITQANIGKPLAIFVNDRLINSPIVQSAITDGKAIIAGNFTTQEANTLVEEINSSIVQESGSSSQFLNDSRLEETQPLDLKGGEVFIPTTKNEKYQIKEGVVYYGDTKRPDIDLETFQVINQYFAKDKNLGFLNGNKIEGSDGATFSYITEFYSKDKNSVFFGNEKIEGANPNTFKIEN